ncbi:uncharacterized protein M437DRAFT_82539 [Aureobasidium melanogenum CBS 110374]|uniref:Uncharacterized protein n=1 Tax=Aureobasidium melanogenum (strain CBS 110374) TaxID=1043003 RepID=A0A074W3L7_AURM1|nr:uncharacterized protein M437DRAFT_82539 [Aureobasidium melanogenum CBS 110374]KEQ64522.1 hypothetical protein M437DRAFT_82539 [Aureobasidium melanogenum CBS 110374]
MDHKLPYTFHEDAYWAAEPEEINLFADFVVACAEGHISPLAAAQRITNTLASVAWKNKADIDSTNNSNIDSHNGDRPYHNDIELVAVLIGSCISAFPPHSVVHIRLFEMVKSFLKVQKREIPNPLLNRAGEVRCENYQSLDLRPSIPLWEDLRRLSFLSSCEWLAEFGNLWTGVEKCGSREQQRWRNLSYFFARLEVEGIERMDWHSPLQRLLPKYWRIDEETAGWSGYLAGQVLAAAQWFVPKGHASWVWRNCCNCEQMLNNHSRLNTARKMEGDAALDGTEEGTTVDNQSFGRADDEASIGLAQSEGLLWKLENWKVWKLAFQRIEERVNDVRIHAVVRREASKALKIMEDIEAHHR